MDLYVSSALLGVAGLGVMALGGVGFRSQHSSHSGHGHGTSGHGHAGHSHVGHAHIGHSHGGHANVASHAAPFAPSARGSARGGARGGAQGARDAVTNLAWTIASPRFLFSVALGLGVVGMLTPQSISGAPHLAIAVVGGLLFDRFLVTPLWNLAMRFASTPATTLESSVTEDATAVTSFDDNGQGIVSIEVDGQVVQILATLRRDDRALGGARVRAGQRLRIEDVDAEKNRCTVALL